LQETFDSMPLHDYHCALMSAQLPVIVDPLFMVKREFAWSGELETGGMERLATHVSGAAEPISATLEFGREHGKARIRGHVQGQVEMICQRCMLPVTISFDQSFCLGLVQSQAEEERLPEDWEACYINDAEMYPVDVLEEEILLALPLVARHEDVNCAGDPAQTDPESEQAQEQEKRPNPFDVLAQLKQSR